VHSPISRPRLYIGFPRQFFDISLRSTPVYGRGPMYNVFIGAPSTKSIHGPMGKTSFANISGTYIPIGVKLCGKEEDVSPYCLACFA
jgi:hypothetical protein